MRLVRIILLPILVLMLWSGLYSRSKAITEYEYIMETMYNRHDDIDLLARLIFCEVGADYCEDELLYLTGAVIINRVDDDRFPDTIKDVIYAPGQYSVIDKLYSVTYNYRAWKTAVDLILWGCEDTPPDLVYQANFIQGKEVYKCLNGVYLCCG